MEKVIVGCKLPHGLVLHHKGTAVTLKGANSSRVIGGHGLTEVDKGFYEAWLKQHANFAPVKAKAIFVSESRDEAEDAAEERKDVETGFEGLNPDKPAPGVEQAKEKE